VEKTTDIFNMIITYHREKLINAMIYFARNTLYCGKTKLLKLLYFLDFKHFKETGKSVTGQDYYAWDMGPVPKAVFEEISSAMRPDMQAAIHPLPAGEEFQKILPRQAFDGRYFSKREMRLLKDIAFIFRDAKVHEMVESTHFENEPWDRTIKEKGRLQKIDYLLAIDSRIDSLPIEEVVERMKERDEIREIFGET
jgi:uncharacterized phage-associated protein